MVARRTFGRELRRSPGQSSPTRPDLCQFVSHSEPAKFQAPKKHWFGVLAGPMGDRGRGASSRVGAQRDAPKTRTRKKRARQESVKHAAVSLQQAASSSGSPVVELREIPRSLTLKLLQIATLPAPPHHKQKAGERENGEGVQGGPPKEELQREGTHLICTRWARASTQGSAGPRARRPSSVLVGGAGGAVTTHARAAPN